jgi:hypothetical protein
MLWTIAYKEVSGAAVTDVAVPLVSDQTIPVDSNSNPLFPIQMYTAWIWAGGATTTRVRLAAPSYRGILRPYVRPIEQAANPSSRPLISEWYRHPLTIRPTEPYIVLLTNGAAETDYVILTATDGNYNVPQGDLYTSRFTTTFTPTANAWSISNTPVPDDVLPPGRYSIQGMDMFAAGGVAARLAFPGAVGIGALPNIRPGILVPTANGGFNSRWYRWGQLGEFGQFESIAQPLAEVLFTAATANPEFYLDLVQVRVGTLQT